MTNFKQFTTTLFSLTISGNIISAAQIESALRIISLLVTIILSLVVFYQQQKKRTNEKN